MWPLPVAEVPLAVAHQCPLVALHALQLLFGAHAAAGLAGRTVRTYGCTQIIQGTLGSLLVGREGGGSKTLTV